MAAAAAAAAHSVGTSEIVCSLVSFCDAGVSWLDLLIDCVDAGNGSGGSFCCFDADFDCCDAVNDGDEVDEVISSGHWAEAAGWFGRGGRSLPADSWFLLIPVSGFAVDDMAVCVL